MPNWCKNNLRIHSNGEKVLEILEMLKDDDGEFTMNRVVPMPKELEGTTSPTPDTVSEAERKRLMDKYGATNWYDWRNKNWGVKWDASEATFWEKDGDPIISFSTPWVPPYEFVQKLSEKFENVTFVLQFAEENFGGQPLGQTTYINGEEHTDYRTDDEEFADAVWDEEWAEL